MLLHLMRHGIAEPATAAGSDAARALTPEGRARVRRQAVSLRRAGLFFDAILCSPLVRAQQTASLMAAAWQQEPLTDALLRPGCSLDDVAELLGRYPEAQRPLLIGHQPDLEHLVHTLTGSQARIHPGTLAVIDVARLRPGRGLLLGLYDPDLLARLGTIAADPAPPRP